MPRAPANKAGAKATPPKRPAHRPSEYTEAKAARCIRHFQEGGTRHKMGRENNLPDWKTFQRWMDKRPELRHQYACALEDQANALFEEAIHEAREATPETVGVARVRSDVLLRAAARRKPKVYSERVVAGEFAQGWRREAEPTADTVPVRKYTYEVVTSTHPKP